MSEAVVNKFVKIFLPVPDLTTSINSSTGQSKTEDLVFLYATEVGLRVWKFLLLVFKAARIKNYGIEALNLQLQVNYTLSAGQAAELKWSRCINTTKRVGKNVPDLHLEHLN